MLLINCKINLILTWSENCILISGGIGNQVPTFVKLKLMRNFMFHL